MLKNVLNACRLCRFSSGNDNEHIARVVVSSRDVAESLRRYRIDAVDLTVEIIFGYAIVEH